MAMTDKAVIGISCSWHSEKEAPFMGNQLNYACHDYVRSVVEAGAVPVLLPYVDHFQDQQPLLDIWMDHIDGLILTGGHDLEPEQYGQEPQQKLGPTWRGRDTFDIALFREAVKRSIPILGVCRGFQLINVVLGGTLLQDLSYSDTPLLKHVQGHSYKEATHWVTIRKGSILADIAGEKFYVNSWHHQTVQKAGSGLMVSARSSDGVIEAVEDAERHILAVQWHPEMMSENSGEMKRLFRYFADDCVKQRSL